MSEYQIAGDRTLDWTGVATDSLLLADFDEGTHIEFEGDHFDEHVSAIITVEDDDEFLAIIKLKPKHLRALAAWATAVANEIDKGVR